MTQPAPAPPALDPVRWLNNRPYLLLSLTSLFWAGNIVLGRHVAGKVPPVGARLGALGGCFLPAVLRLAASEARLAGDPRQSGRLALLSPTGVAYNTDGLLGPAIHRGAERAADPVDRPAAHRGVDARAVPRPPDAGPAVRRGGLAGGRRDDFMRGDLARSTPLQRRRLWVFAAMVFFALYSALFAAARAALAVAFIHGRARRADADAGLPVGISTGGT